MSSSDNAPVLIPSQENIQDCISLLRHFAANNDSLAALSDEQRISLLKASGELSRPCKYEILKRKKAIKLNERRNADIKQRLARAGTGIRLARQSVVFSAPKQISCDNQQSRREYRKLDSPRNCYICKAEYSDLHSFYDALCPACAELNYKKRFQSAPLDGQVALITGSRLKIGYQAALMMLRAGAEVIATTRFPVDSASRYAREADFSQWAKRLHVYGLDLRHTPSVEIFCNFIEQKYRRLDILINNAAQTVRRPAGFYAHLIANEMLPSGDLPGEVIPLLSDYEECKRFFIPDTRAVLDPCPVTAITWAEKTPGIGLRVPAQLSQVPYVYDNSDDPQKCFPAGKLDCDLQQVDLRKTNSWRLCLGDIPTAEMLEIQLVNAIAPFVLCNKLAPLMKRDNTGRKHIVNVSAMEGKFLRFKKGERHPHTNMAKAALNMLTHTSAEELSKYGIFMNAVDTGWVTDEDPAALAAIKQERHDFQPPLDIVDGAARVCDPFFDGILTGKHWCGKFLKDYFPIDW